MDVFFVILAIGGLLTAIPFSFFCCCNTSRKQVVLVSFYAWFLVTSIIGLLWHGLGQEWNRSYWSDAKGGDVKSFTPWTASWKTSSDTLLIVPSNEEELRNAVINAKKLPLRVVGSGLSWSSTGYTDGTIIDIRKLNAAISLEYTNPSIMGYKRYQSSDKIPLPTIPSAIVTVQAGMKVQDAVQYLTARGLCLYGTGSVRAQSIGGVISHGIHGSHPDGLNRHIVGLKVLYANGTFNQITSKGDLYMWGSSMGMLGVIVHVSFEVFPLVRLSFHRSPIQSYQDFNQIVKNLDINLASTFTGFLYPSPCSKNIGYQRVGTYIGTDTMGELKNQTEFGPRLQLYFNDHMHPAMQYMFSPFGTIVSCIEQMLANVGSSTLLSGDDEDILPNDGLIPQFFEIIDYEYMIPTPNCATFARELMEGRFGKVLIPVCIRLVRAELSCLSLAAVDSCVFGVESMRGMTHTLDFEAIEERVGELGGRAHFGKVAALSFKAYDYPCLPHFQAYRRELDPKSIFLTPFLSGLIREVDLHENEFGPAVETRNKAWKRSALFSTLSWMIIIGAFTYTCVYSSCIYSKVANYRVYTRVPQKHVFRYSHERAIEE
jgi:hypothetical protein